MFSFISLPSIVSIVLLLILPGCGKKLKKTEEAYTVKQVDKKSKKRRRKIQPSDQVNHAKPISSQVGLTPDVKVPVKIKSDIKIPDDAVLIDSMTAIAFSPNGTEVVTQSDLIRPSLAGTQRTLDEIIFESLVYLDAQKFKIMSDDESVDKYLSAVQKENNLTMDQLKDIFAQSGYSYQEGREQFKRLQTVNMLLDMKIRQNLIVPKKAVEDYYNENPVTEPAAYEIQRTLIPYKPGAEKALQKAELVELVKTGKGAKAIVWSEPFWIEQEDIAEDKAFLLKLKKGQIYLPIETQDGFELFRLKDKKESRVVPLDERYKEIVEILKRPKYNQLMDEYKKKLFDSVSILYF